MGRSTRSGGGRRKSALNYRVDDGSEEEIVFNVASPDKGGSKDSSPRKWRASKSRSSTTKCVEELESGKFKHVPPSVGPEEHKGER